MRALVASSEEIGIKREHLSIIIEEAKKKSSRKVRKANTWLLHGRRDDNGRLHDKADAGLITLKEKKSNDENVKNEDEKPHTSGMTGEVTNLTFFGISFFGFGPRGSGGLW